MDTKIRSMQVVLPLPEINSDSELLPAPLVRLIISYIGIGHMHLALANGECSDTLAWMIGYEGDLIAMNEIPGICNDDDASINRYACVIIGGIESGNGHLTAAGMKLPITTVRAATRFGDFNFMKQIIGIVGYKETYYPISELPSRISAASNAIKSGNFALAESWVKHYMQYTPDGVEAALWTAIRYKYTELLDIFVRLGCVSWTSIATRALSAQHAHSLEYAVQRDPSALGEALTTVSPDMIRYYINSGKYGEKVCAIMGTHLRG